MGINVVLSMINLPNIDYHVALNQLTLWRCNTELRRLQRNSVLLKVPNLQLQENLNVISRIFCASHNGTITSVPLICHIQAVMMRRNRHMQQCCIIKAVFSNFGNILNECLQNYQES